MQAGDRNGNALPGTIVEHDITHPFEYDFCECSNSRNTPLIVLLTLGRLVFSFSNPGHCSSDPLPCAQGRGQCTARSLQGMHSEQFLWISSSNYLQRMIYQHCYQFMRSTTPVSLCRFSLHQIDFDWGWWYPDPAVYYAHIASLRSRAHEDAPAGGPVRGGAKFVEQQQDAAIAASHLNRPPPSVKTAMDMHTEVLPLTPLGKAAPMPEQTNIKTSMWFI